MAQTVPTIYLSDLLNARACRNQVELFRETFGDKVEFSPENMQRALDAGLEVIWAINWLKPDFTGWIRTNENDLYCYKNGRLHRDGDKPAVIDACGRFWYKNGNLHRDGDKPAVILRDGSRFWYKNDAYHRIGKPAFQTSDGHEYYYENGERVDAAVQSGTR